MSIIQMDEVRASAFVVFNDADVNHFCWRLAHGRVVHCIEFFIMNTTLNDVHAGWNARFGSKVPAGSLEFLQMPKLLQGSLGGQYSSTTHPMTTPRFVVPANRTEWFRQFINVASEPGFDIFAVEVTVEDGDSAVQIAMNAGPDPMTDRGKGVRNR